MLTHLKVDELVFAADVMLVFHFGVALFIGLGQLSIVAGGILNIRWIRNAWFRVLHLGLIVFIAAETWLGVNCPLTRFEQDLRILAEQPAYVETFTEHWLSPILFWSAPSWIFSIIHSVAALVIAATWFYLPPHWHRERLVHD